MRTVWKILTYDLKNIFTISKLSAEDYGSIIVCSTVYCCSMVAMLLGLYGAITAECQLILLGNCFLIFVIWYVSAIINLFIIANWPGMSYLDKGTVTTRRFYFIAGPLLYPKLLCLALFLAIETTSVTTVLRLFRRPINDWHDVLAFSPHMSISSIGKYRKYLRE